MNLTPTQARQILANAGIEVPAKVTKKWALSVLEKAANQPELLAALDVATEGKIRKFHRGTFDISKYPVEVRKAWKYAFKKHILLEGEKGSGKTYSLTKLTSELKIPTVFIAGHEGLEAIDLLGYYIPDGKGALVWKDGALTEAFRLAKKGKAILIFDELLRVPSRELNILVGALSPNAQGNYVLRTGRVLESKDGIAVEETIEVPQWNLWVVATTNVGAGYAVDEIDDALADRFRIIRKDSSVSEIKKILKAIGANEDIIDALVKFYRYTKELVKKGELNKHTNLRQLVEAVKFSDGTKEAIIDNVVDLVPHLVDRTPEGELNSEQETLVLEAIKKAFDIKEGGES